jgi:ferrous iron transport protein B
MSATAETILTVALIGNPNTGKSTLFSALAGMAQHAGNYPGCTVEKKTGRMRHAGRRYDLIDLPGLYGLSPQSRDEMVAVDVLFGRQKDTAPVDAVICIVDAANLPRNLYLVSLVRELGLPTVVAVNMLDVAAARSITLDLPRLERQLGVPVVGIQAHRRVGIEELKTALARIVGRTGVQGSGFRVQDSDVLQSAIRNLHSTASPHPDPLPKGEGESMAPHPDPLRAPRSGRGEEESAARYAWIERVLDGVLTEPSRFRLTVTDRIDGVLTHRLWGLLFFAAVMFLVFQSVFTWARPAMEAIESITSAAGGFLERHLAEGVLRSFLVGGILSGVGSVLAFLPQILVLFFFLGILEDCGYLARAAFLMDRFMARIGLCGKSFIPLCSCFACTVPGIMATRVIENDRNRLTTILVAPLLTCSARLPVYALLIAAFIPTESYCGGLFNLQGLTLAGLYLLGMVTAVAAALVLKKTVLRGPAFPFILDLPSYKWPSLRTVLQRVLQRGCVFLRTAGTLILAVSMLVWAGLYFPHNSRAVAPLIREREELQRQVERLDAGDLGRKDVEGRIRQLAREIDAAYQRHSVLGTLGHYIEPAVKPLGWDWRIGCAVIASLPAREVVVATMGVMYNADDGSAEGDENDRDLQQRLRAATWAGSNQPVFNIPVALSIMVFFALCAQCAATLAVMRRETNSWRWPAFTFGYMTVLAYLGALVTYQAGMWIAGGM